MKKVVVAISALVIFVMFSSCIFMGPSIRGNGNVVEETRTVDNFSKVKASRGTNVYISQGNVEKVVVKADENIVDVIKTKVENGVLVITNTHQIRKATSNKVYVTVKEIEKISAFAGSNVYSETALKIEQLELSSSAGSNIKLDVLIKELKVSATAGANIYLDGEADNFEASASAGSNIKAEGLQTKNCKARVNSGANVYITVSDELDAKASSGGNFYYYGNPKSLNISNSSGGNVNKRDISSNTEKINQEQFFGTWKLSGKTIGQNMTSFQLKADSSAIVVWGDSVGKQEKNGKWKWRPEKKMGNSFFGVTVNSGIFITVEMDKSQTSVWGFTVKEKGGSMILSIGDDKYEKH